MTRRRSLLLAGALSLAADLYPVHGVHAHRHAALLETLQQSYWVMAALKTVQ